MQETEVSPAAQTAIKKIRALRNLQPTSGTIHVERAILNKLNAKDTLAVALELSKPEVSRG